MWMQLKSIALSALLVASLEAGDSVGVHYMYYDEDSARTIVKSPSFSLHKEIGFDYDIDIHITHDTVSGASPTYFDAASGASARLPEGIVYPQDIVYGDIPYEDHRTAFSLSVTKRSPVTRDEMKFGYSYSNEEDYLSQELSFGMLHYLDASKNSSIGYGVSYQRNKPKIYCFLDPNECDAISGASAMSVTKRLEAINLFWGYTQILSQTSLARASIFAIFENGYLSNPYMRVVRNYGTFDLSITPEKKPSKRNAIGFVLEYKEAFEEVMTNVSYRFYSDDWSIVSHTLDCSLTKEFAKSDASVGIRYYNQSRAFFYSALKDYFTTQRYASSDRRMASFDSWNVRLCWSYHYNKRITFDIDGGYYLQPRYYHSLYSGIGVRYRF